MATARASEERWRADAPLSESAGLPTTSRDIVSIEGTAARYGSTAVADASCTTDAPAFALSRKADAAFVGQFPSTSAP